MCLSRAERSPPLPVLRGRSKTIELNVFVGHDGGHVIEKHFIGEVVRGLDFDDDSQDGREVGDERSVSSERHCAGRLTSNIRLAQPIGTVLNRHVVRHG